MKVPLRIEINKKTVITPCNLFIKLTDLLSAYQPVDRRWM